MSYAEMKTRDMSVDSLNLKNQSEHVFNINVQLIK